VRKFKFVHTADLHLDSPFLGLQSVSPHVANKLREATFQTFERIIDLCLDIGAEFLLIAGDIYDSRDRSLRAQLQFRDSLKRLSDSGIPAFVVHGNHDPLNSWSASLDWPAQVHVFGGGSVTSAPVIRDGETIAHVYGTSYPTQDVRKNLTPKFKRTEKGPFSIGLLHCNVGENTGHESYAPCSLEDLRQTGIDYWALGHVHTHQVLSDAAPVVLYPGNPQGRNPRELGPRGCYVVDVDGRGHTGVEFVEVDTVRWFWDSIEIEQLETDEALIAALEETCRRLREDSAGRPTIGRLRITGRGPLHRSLTKPSFVTELLERVQETEGNEDPFVWVERIMVHTRPPIDLEERRSGQDFVADFLNLVDSYRQDPKRIESLREHLGPLFESGRAHRLLDNPTDDQLRQWLEAAETYCLDVLALEEE